MLSVSRSRLRYRSRRKDNDEIESKVMELSRKHRKYGSKRIYILLRKEGYKVNHKKVERIYRTMCLQLKKKRRVKKQTRGKVSLPHVTRPNQVWVTDFIFDALMNGRKLKNMPVLDLYGRCCLHIETSSSIRSVRVIEIMERLMERHGVPEMILTDNGREFVSKKYKKWAVDMGIQLCYIQPGKPVENAYMESFNDKFREECLNEHYFINMPYAQAVIEEWRKDYNTKRPHSSLGYMTPEEYVNRNNKLTEEKEVSILQL